ncbi:hypothetical protein [Vibrio mediterranei]|uniref:hypothetical protein n=1 Tax=Vibrio mediterranei TaxID=689 RepID=UPI00406906E5
MSANGSNHGWLANLFTVDSPEGHYLGEEKEIIARANQDLAVFVKEIENNPRAKKFILSSEFLSSCGIDTHRQLRELFSKYFKKITVIAYLKEPLSKYASHVSERVRRGGATLEEAEAEIDFNFTKDKIQSLYEVYGADSVKIRHLHTKKLVDQSLLKDFQSIVGCEKLQVNEVRSNNSVSEASLHVASYANKKGKALSSYVLSLIPGKKYKPKQSDVNNIIKHNSIDIDYLSNEFDIEIESGIVTEDNSHRVDMPVYDSETLAELLIDATLSEDEIDLLRDSALLLLNKNHKQQGLKLLKLASRLRPEGSFMKNRIQKEEKK